MKAERRKPTINLPSVEEIRKVLTEHPLIRLEHPIVNAWLIGSFAAGNPHNESDVDILIQTHETEITADRLTEIYRRPLQQYFVTHNVRGKCDEVHPQWDGRRVDLYFTYGKTDDRPKKLLPRTHLFSDNLPWHAGHKHVEDIPRNKTIEILEHKS